MESSNQNIKLNNRGGKMNIIFMRHGNATDNVKEIISDKEIYWSTLTEVEKPFQNPQRHYLAKLIKSMFHHFLEQLKPHIQFHKSTRLQIL